MNYHLMSYIFNNNLAIYGGSLYIPMYTDTKLNRDDQHIDILQILYGFNFKRWYYIHISICNPCLLRLNLPSKWRTQVCYTHIHIAIVVNTHNFLNFSKCILFFSIVFCVSAYNVSLQLTFLFLWSIQNSFKIPINYICIAGLPYA